MKIARRVFVTGTGTGVGKTVVAAMLMAGRGGRYWKPVQSGAAADMDSRAVREMAGLAAEAIVPETHVLTAPLSPHAAAAREGRTIALDDFVLPADDGNPLVVEGAGGVLVPLNDKEMMIDLMAALDLPVLVAAPSALGTINHTLLTLEALRRRGLAVCGVVMCGEDNPGNREAVAGYGRVAVGWLPRLPRLEPDALRAAWEALG